jgi:bifunctional UDP-N-acetylglucosamine pyrophosphorylase/glucosamine-1-phosphate N-acetyltransferase
MQHQILGGIKLSQSLAAVVMAAGKSTRMKSALPKAAHKICGKPVTGWVVDACKDAGVSECVVVVGYEAELVKEALGADLRYALQAQQLGTGHACMQAVPELSSEVQHVLVVPGDTPLITKEALKTLIDTHISQGNAATLLTAVLEDAGHYGRILRDENNAVKCIREAKDCSAEELAIVEFNVAIYCFELSALREKLSLLKTDNAQGEYYLTDVISLMYNDGLKVVPVVCPDYEETLGINNRVELAEAGRVLRKRIAEKHMLAGVSIVDPAATYIDWNVEIGNDTTIHPGCVIEGDTHIGSNCQIGPFAHLKSVTIANGSAG